MIFKKCSKFHRCILRGFDFIETVYELFDNPSYNYMYIENHSDDGPDISCTARLSRVKTRTFGAVLIRKNSQWTSSFVPRTIRPKVDWSNVNTNVYNPTGTSSPDSDPPLTLFSWLVLIYTYLNFTYYV